MRAGKCTRLVFIGRVDELAEELRQGIIGCMSSLPPPSGVKGRRARIANMGPGKPAPAAGER